MEHSKQSNPQPHPKKSSSNSGENPPLQSSIPPKPSLPPFNTMYSTIDVDQMPDNILREIFIGHEKESKDIGLEHGLRNP